MTTARIFVAEPPARYGLSPPAVVDCSVLVGALFEEHWRDEALQSMAGLSLNAPHLLQYEITNVALKKARHGFGDLAAQALAAWTRTDIELHRIDETATAALAQRYTLSAYDAAYLWLAAELRCPLITFDERLGAAARIHLAGLP